jgi:hypothetical protein
MRSERGTAGAEFDLKVESNAYKLPEGFLRMSLFFPLYLNGLHDPELKKDLSEANPCSTR